MEEKKIKASKFIFKKTISSIHATCFHPDAVQLIVGAGDKVLVYDASDGNLIDTLKGKIDKLQVGSIINVSNIFQGIKISSTA